jgi:hypothetical protein
MLIVLHGAKKNVGDFLIRERGLAILRHLRPDQELVVLPRWKPLEPAVVDRADGIVLCGGPGLASNFYPQMFPLVPRLQDLDIPVLPLALGWSGQPTDAPDRFAFDGPSLEALRRIHDRIGWSGVRDDVTRGIVESADVGRVRRTGCVAWYEVSSLDQPLVRPQYPRRIVYTTAAGASRKDARDAAQILRLLRRRFPGAERWCVFHRGILPGGGTNAKESAMAMGTAALAKTLGFRVLEASGDLSAIDFYRDADLHVGYRVHAHLMFLSHRRPSILINQDGRGVGQSVSLHDPYRLMSDDPDLSDRIDEALGNEIRSRYESSVAAVDEMRSTWPVMRETVEQLPA